MERKLFVELVRSATREVTARHADYFDYYRVEMLPFATLAKRYRVLPLFEQFSPAELETALVRGVQVLDDLGVPVELGATRSDAISMLVAQSILDAYSVSVGALHLPSPPPPIELSADVLADRYFVEQAAEGASYAIGKESGLPLLIISTTGAPIGIWSNLLCDSAINRQCIVVQSRGSTLLDGGTPYRSSSLQDAADIAEVLLQKGLRDVDVVAWCNGSRTAIELARRVPALISSLVLVAPTFFNATESETYPSPFEEGIWNAHQVISRDPDIGRQLMEAVTRSHSTESARLNRDPEKRVDEVLRMPPHAHVGRLLVPLSTPEFFRNYLDRLSRDATYDVRSALAEVRCPILLIVGTHDGAVNTAAATDMLTDHGRNVLQVRISGAGHHIHLLQHAYFRYLLNCWFSRSTPGDTARLEVQRLAETDAGNVASVGFYSEPKVWEEGLGHTANPV